VKEQADRTKLKLTETKYGLVNSPCNANNQSSPKVSNSSCNNSFFPGCDSNDLIKSSFVFAVGITILVGTDADAWVNSDAVFGSAH
jgi:hypothetical protein